MNSAKQLLEIKGSIWLQKTDHKFLGGDQINFFEKIDELGSIRKAAKAAGISYKTAWESVSMFNSLTERPLVDCVTGGIGGGGASLTTEGKKIIAKFKTIQEEHRKFLENLQDRLSYIDNL
jgi:molybdate transport system regulatory protein